MCQKTIATAALLLLVSSCHAIKYSSSPPSPQAQSPPDFTCPEDFGYFPHPSDCSQYYVCVFGGALLESCTGGLMYSNELQTCDWPRNVNQNYCHGNNTLQETIPKKPQKSRGHQRTTPPPTTSYVYKPIKIENYSDLSSVIATRNEQEEEGARSGRSYAQSGPEKEFYNKNAGVGGLTGSYKPHKPPWKHHHRKKRQILFNFLDKLGFKFKKYDNLPKTMATQNFYIPTSERKNNHGPNSLIYPNHYDNPIYRNILNPKLLTTKNPIKLNFKSKPTIHLNQNHHLKLQMNNFDKFKPFPVAMGINKFFPTTTMTTTRTTTGKFYPPTLTPKYVPKEELDYDDDYSETMTTTTTTTKRPYFTTSRRSVSGSSKYSPQIATDYNANDYSYANQRYASGVTNVTWQQPAVATATPVEEEDDESYYVYEDAAGNQQDVDVDYKYQHPITTRRPITTPAPAPPPTRRTTTTPPKQKSRTSPPTRSRPTLKPKSSIVPKDLPPVRDVYLDAPSRPAPFYETPIPNTPATKCNRELCQIPDCNCGGKEIPSGLRPEETPQIVLLTFDDSVNDLNKNLYRDLFEKGRKNPNGCPISATFYVSHEWTDYSQVQNLAADGHEIASHSVSHSFGESFSQKKWEKEINGQREILSAYGGVKLSEVRGMRAPFLAIGGNNMFKMLHDVNFTYDSSMPVYENRPPSWPYTLDYKIFHDCMIPPCPTKSYPGVWEVPMVMWTDLKGGRCSMGDACSNPPTAEGVYQFLAKNFERHYTTNRAPFGLYYHAAWFTQAHHKEGFEAFLDTLVQMDDVWLVTNWQAIQWVRNPTPSSKINEFAPWNECRTREHRPPRCNHSRVCNLWHKSGVRYLKTCQNCPEQYPWTGNTGVPFTI